MFRIPTRLALWLALSACGLIGLAATGHAGSSADVDAVLAQARAKGSDDFLPPDQAFHLSAAPGDAGSVRLTWQIAQGYYLYRDRIKIAAADGSAATLGAPQFPEGQTKQDEYFGKQVVYHNELIVTVPVQAAGSSAQDVALKVTYQGCAEAGLCYAPMTRTVSAQLPPGAGSASVGGPGAGSAAASAAAGSASAAQGYVSEQDRLAERIRTGNPLLVMGYFFAMGLGLAFTPCCWPMVPILSGLIVGSGQRVTASRGFLLSLTYVLGMALTYTVTGAAFAAAGKQVQAAFQQPWIIGLFAALFVALALAMFGLYTVQMPGFIQSRLADTSNRQRSGTFGGVAVMGMLSALIVTTCVAPVLVATLVVIGQSGAVARGAAALFAMSFGMGAPLLVIGSSAGRWMPKAGVWMDGVKRLFGAFMLALAVWMLSRIVSERTALLLFAIPALVAAVVLWGFVPASRTQATLGRWSARTAALLVALYGVALIVGGSRGATDPLHPLQASSASEEPAFHSIASLADLQREVQAAAAAHQPVMLDFYADWCTSCKEMQRYTFTDPQVRAELRSVRLLRADVTANSADDQALLHEFQIYGPPTIAFYDAQGHEHHEFRVVGYLNAPKFSALLQQALSAG